MKPAKRLLLIKAHVDGSKWRKGLHTTLNTRLQRYPTTEIRDDNNSLSDFPTLVPVVTMHIREPTPLRRWQPTTIYWFSQGLPWNSKHSSPPPPDFKDPRKPATRHSQQLKLERVVVKILGTKMKAVFNKPYLSVWIACRITVGSVRGSVENGQVLIEQFAKCKYETARYGQQRKVGQQ